MITKSDCYLKPNTSLKNILKEFRDIYKQFVDVYYNEHIKGLSAGATLPPKDRIYSEKGKEEFSEYCDKYQGLASYIFDTQLETIHKKMAETPSADVSAMIGMLSTRENITEDEITHLLEEYGANHQVYRALQDIGKKHNMTILDDEIMTREADMRALRHDIEKALTIYTAESKPDSYYDFLSIPIDNAIADTPTP